MLDWIRFSLFFEQLKLCYKAHFYSAKKKYANQLQRVKQVRRQSQRHYAVGSPQLFIDISNLVFRDGKTGIHRVVRSVASCVSRLEGYKGYRLSLVYASPYRLGYWHAFEYERSMLGKEGLPNRDQPIDFKQGDIFFELDWNLRLAAFQRPFYERMVAAGVKVFFNVFDIIPLSLHELNSEKSRNTFESWLLEASRYTGVLCNSQAVAEDYREWRREKGLSEDFIIDWFHLGADIENSLPSKGLSGNAQAVLDSIRATASILMVSSLHPRKGYAQALDAFELLWKAGSDVKLVIVGKDYPNNGNLAQRLREHPEQGRRLIWLENISDEYLDFVYKASTAVLFASRAEGFGLAVWEGARYGKPLILRDLPVFRELAGDNAMYFSGLEPDCLACAIADWLKLYENGIAPASNKIKILSWEQSFYFMLEKLICLSEDKNYLE